MGEEKSFLAGRQAGRRVSAASLPYQVSESYHRFDQRDSVFAREHWDPEFRQFLEESLHGQGSSERGNAHLGGRRLESALNKAAWNVARYAPRGTNVGFYQWLPAAGEEPLDITAEEASQTVKEVARFLGADLVGITGLDKRWYYQSVYSPRGSKPIVFTDEMDRPEGNTDRYLIPESMRFVIVLGFAMDPELLRTSPGLLASAATGLGYSRMAFSTSSLARFISELGYHAIPQGNDTSLSIPQAIYSGLRELGRNGLLLTQEYGPAVRLSKVLTNLPLEVDSPKRFGFYEFCHGCQRCAEACPGKAISLGAPSMSGPSRSNNNGVRKWYVDPEKCLLWWRRIGTSCSGCIASCPLVR